ncbi:hypothetical protein N665_2011s0004 [Sinapis alba]|nr:hypothetical protein N665_2011s0004 [Sinapis alba]
MCVRRNNNINLTTVLDSKVCRTEAFGMECELDCAGHHHHHHSSVVTTIIFFFSATLFIPLSLKIHIHDGFHEIL